MRAWFYRHLWCGLVLAFGLGLAMDARATDIQLSSRPMGSRDVRYNLRLGTMYMGYSGRVAAGYNDNFSYANDASGGRGDFYFTPELRLSMYWPISPYVQIDSGLTFGYRFFTSESEGNNWYVHGEGGGVSADITGQLRIGDDSTIILQESLSREIDTISVAARDVNAGYAATRNTLSATYSKALNRSTTGSVRVAHSNLWTDGGDFDHHDNVTDSIDVLVLYRLMQNLQIGPYARWSSIRFTEDERNNRNSFELGVSSVGSFTAGGLVSYSASIGFEALAVDTGNSPTATDDDGGLTTNFQLAVNPVVFPGHRFRVSYKREHEQLSPLINYADQFLIGYGLDFRATSDLIVSSDIDWMDIRESDGGEHANLWRLSFRTRYRLTEAMSLGALYRFTFKSSDDSNRGYDQNIFEISLNYDF